VTVASRQEKVRGRAAGLSHRGGGGSPDAVYIWSQHRSHTGVFPMAKMARRTRQQAQIRPVSAWSGAMATVMPWIIGTPLASA
jgi:hypothetical protein